MRKKIFSVQIRFLLFNFLITLLISLRNLFSSGSSIFNIYGYVMLISNTAMLYIAPFILIALAGVIIPKKYPLLVISSVVMLVFQTLVFVDSVVYSIYKFHINGAVLTIFSTGGFGDSVKIGFFNGIVLTIAILAFFVLELFVFMKIFKAKTRRALFVSNRPNWTTYTLVALLFFVLLDKGVFAISDLFNRVSIIRYQKVFPLYQPLTIKRVMEKQFGFKVNREESFKVDSKQKIMNYPKNELKSQKSSKQNPNIIVIISDAYRWDMLNDSVSPKIYQFGKKSKVYERHYSGGNASRFGVFSLFYGITANYWHTILAERQPPVLFSELKENGYEFFIGSSTSLTYPEFRKTIFLEIPSSISDNLEGETAYEKDINLQKEFLTFLKAHNRETPFFTFLYFDAPHAHEYPPEFERFTPSTKKINYLKIDDDESNIQRMLNTYRNTIYFNDYLIGGILDTLDSQGFLKNTLVFITADHGQEYFETGYYGHTSAFSDYQTRVPLVYYDPDLLPSVITNLTSANDIVPTILTRLGYKNPPSDYVNGRSLTSTQKRDYVIAGGWADAAIITRDNYFVFSTETYNIGDFQIRDNGYRLIENYKPILQKNRETILAAMSQFSDFFK